MRKTLMLAACALPGTALALDSTDIPDVLPEVIVTSQKFAQAVEDVPVSVGTIDGTLTRQTGASSFEDIQSYVGNVTLSLSPTGGDFFIRGFGTLSTNAGFEPSVGTVVDGVFYGRSNFLSVFYSDIERMEVLRGPQGTLFGKNSTAGVFSLITQAPQQDFNAGGELFVTDDGQRALRPVLNLPLAEGWALRYAGSLSSDEGLLYNSALSRHELNFQQNSSRLRLGYHGEDLHLDLAGFYSQQHFNANNFQLVHVTAPMLTLMRQYDPQAEDRTDFHNSANVPSRGDTRFAGASLSLDYRLDGLADIDQLQLSSISAWARQTLLSRDIDADFSPVPVLRDTLVKPAPFSQRSEELRLAGHDDSILGFGHALDFVIGAYYYDAHLNSSDLIQLEDLGATLAYVSAAQSGNPDNGALLNLAGVPLARLGLPLAGVIDVLTPLLGPAIGQQQSAAVTLSQRTSTAALFGQMEYFVLEDWGLILGARVGRETKQGQFSSKAEGVFIPAIANQKDFDTHRQRSEIEFSPKAGLKWHLSEASNLYATWTRGYKSGGFNALPLNDEHLEFEPERATSLELGAKSRLWADTLRVSAALFDTRFDDLQVSTYAGTAPIFLNAASARSRGGELELHWLTPLHGLAFYSSLGYTNAFYTSYPNAPDCAVSSQCHTPKPASGTQDLSGKTLSNAPHWTAAAIPSYSMPLPGATVLTVAVDLLYRSQRYVDVDLAPAKLQSATTELNARLLLGADNERWLLSLAARNLGREVILDQVLDQPLAPGGYGGARADRGRVLSANLQLKL
ncbi:Outer membrane receptor proteins, mostly Fe transport [Solimonas aquatica]|uniref:Outer membrane receptor proteins, mostly Fe transport n=1 Tax=Solimonas aquatica TaxID=489703 RepID=A0A1H9E0P4_9GAMM|nr:TonB-dependent receptor [Solimonas aquatica]SEQ18508.1 Outer membrane receptor proteins, mostly Fe transport [Solimonas aquatica]